MRYQSFYPFANQQRYAQESPQPYQQSFQQHQSYMPQHQPGQPDPQGAFQGFSPFSMDHLMGGASQQPGSAPQAGSQSKPEMYMETANRLITTVQQYAPIVQQFAPMIQNIPAMWKLYRGFQSLPDAGAATGAAGAVSAAARPAAAAGPRPSVPKVFQPPI